MKTLSQATGALKKYYSTFEKPANQPGNKGYHFSCPCFRQPATVKGYRELLSMRLFKKARNDNKGYHFFGAPPGHGRPVN